MPIPFSFGIAQKRGQIYCMRRIELSAFSPSRVSLSPEFQLHEKGHIFLLPPYPTVKLCHCTERNIGEKVEISDTRIRRTFIRGDEQNSHFFLLSSLWAGVPGSYTLLFTLQPHGWYKEDDTPAGRTQGAEKRLQFESRCGFIREIDAFASSSILAHV